MAQKSSTRKTVRKDGDLFVVRDSFIVKNEKGLHTRPSTELVKCAASFNCRVNLFYREYIVNAKSLLGILMLAANKGSRITVEAEGTDAEDAMDALIELAKNKFHIKY